MSAADSPSSARFEQTRERILDGAARLFNQRGIKAGTLAEVATSVGLATNSLTYYYRRKEDLVAACLLRSISVVSAVVDAASTEPDLASRVRGFITRFVALMADIAAGRQPELIFFSDMRALPQPQAGPVFEAYTQLFRSVRGLLRPAQAQAERSAAQRRAHNAQAHLLLSLAIWSRAWLGRYEPEDQARAGQWLADVLLHGLAAPGQRWPVQNGLANAPTAAASGEAETQADITELTRAAYLRTATRLVNEQGLGGASVARIAAQLDLTKGSFYHHHSTKEALILACFERSFELIRQCQRRAAAAPGNGWERLLQATLPLARLQLSDQGPLLRATAWSALPAALRWGQFSIMNRLGERFGAFIVEGMVDGSLRLLDPGVAAQQINGMINGLAELEHWVPGVDSTNVVELYAKPLMIGMLQAQTCTAVHSPRLSSVAGQHRSAGADRAHI